MCNIILCRGCWKKFSLFLSHFFVQCNSLYRLRLSDHSDIMGVANESHVITFNSDECFGQVTERSGKEYSSRQLVGSLECCHSHHLWDFFPWLQELRLVYVSHMELEGNTVVGRGREALNDVIPTVHRTSLHSSSVGSHRTLRLSLRSAQC